MKYSKEYIEKLNFYDYINLVAKELKDNGYKETGIDNDDSDYDSVLSDQDEYKYFIFGVTDEKAMTFLKRIGLIDNGKCPRCGNVFKTNDNVFRNGINPKINFQVCEQCANELRRMHHPFTHCCGRLFFYILLISILSII